ncbi:MAG: Bax inhibitor-1/YccA family protein [Clostridiaceae bacterium]|nr:Bax inhibitor-1/YccA family protein [Clostridiaceae bacterium]
MYYNQNGNYNARTYEEEFATVRGMNAFIAKVYGWMFLGLLLTAGVSFYVASNANLMYTIFSNNFLFYGLMIGELILVAVLSARITRMRFASALTMFLVYAALNGITLSVLLIAFTGESITSAFAITAVTFGVMSIYGYVTRADLTQFRSILFMGLIGVLILSLVNIFLRSSGLEWFISLVSLFVFLGLTAYDMQKLKGYYFGTQGNVALRNNLGIIGALSLYLDFINLFLTLLRLFGRSSRD